MNPPALYAARLEPQQITVYNVHTGAPHMHISLGAMGVKAMIPAGDTLSVQFENNHVMVYDMAKRTLIRG